jgi:hypothetical protein
MAPTVFETQIEQEKRYISSFDRSSHPSLAFQGFLKKEDVESFLVNIKDYAVLNILDDDP